MVKGRLLLLLLMLLLVPTLAGADPSFEGFHPLNGKIAVQTSESLRTPAIPLRLASGAFDPLAVTQEPSHPPVQGRYHLIQFDGPIRPEWREAVEATGATILEYVPEFAYLVRTEVSGAKALSQVPRIRWTGPYLPAYKISPALLNTAATASENAGIQVILFPGEDVDAVAATVTRAGGQIIGQTATKWKTALQVTPPEEGSANLIESLSGTQAVRWIEPAPRWKLHNNKSSDVMNLRAARDSHGLTGKGQIVAVCDTGLDRGSTDPAHLHPDFTDGQDNSRVVAIYDWSGLGAFDFDGHGTHVAGSVLGNGLQSGSTPAASQYPPTSFAGSAPEASLVFQATADDSGNLIGIPGNLYVLFDQAYGVGARIHTNSWGSSASSFYNSFSRDVDEFVWDNRDFLIFFSAGNDGIDRDRDGIVDLFSLGPPSTAKNCVTVGASEGDRPDGSGWNTNYGHPWPKDYAAEPLFSDPLADNPNGMAAFSSRGPVLDGRYKPDIVAPGTNILSTRSALASGGSWGPYNSWYYWMGGTSMACPLTAGSAALVRQYLTETIGLASPSAALLKAALLNGAQDIAPGQFGFGPEREIPDGPGPNNVSGWGRVDIGGCVFPPHPKSFHYFDENTAEALSTGQTRSFSVQVEGSDQPLKVNLVWSDYPGSEASQGGLVNDLDLSILHPSGQTTYADKTLQSSLYSLKLGSSVDAHSTADLRAVRFTPKNYPAVIDSVTFFPSNPLDVVEPMTVSVRCADGPGNTPGTPLFSTTLDYMSPGLTPVTIPVIATVESGPFFIVFEKSSPNIGIFVDDTPTLDDSLVWDGQQWVLSMYTPFVGVNIRNIATGPGFDRVNNVLGATISDPSPGEYVIQIHGHNVPMGPQTYALVASGAVTIETYTVNATAGNGGAVSPEG
ncbi:MAG: hypothetical protein EOM25_13305, partial [Deltaproteobacteria bacterium]|nr:hypothetical protein [Deltaproteobacteria bacterium]